MAGRRIEDFQPTNADSECKVYFETICTNPNDYTAISTDNGCERVPVRLCAEGCRIQEGPMTCKDIFLSLLKEVPREECEIVPQKTCKTVTKLYPELIPQEHCSTSPKEICQLKFSPDPELPAIQPLIQRYCLRGSIEQNLVEDESAYEGKSFPDDIKISEKSIIGKGTKENERKNLEENLDNISQLSGKGPQARKLEIDQSDINQVPEYYQKELEYERSLEEDEEADSSEEDLVSDKLVAQHQVNEEINEMTTDGSALDLDYEIDETTFFPTILIDEGSGEEDYSEELEEINKAGTVLPDDNEFYQTTAFPNILLQEGSGDGIEIAEYEVYEEINELSADETEPILKIEESSGEDVELNAMTTYDSLGPEDYDIDQTSTSIDDFEEQFEGSGNSNEDIRKMTNDSPIQDVKDQDYNEEESTTDFPIVIIDEQFEDFETSNLTEISDKVEEIANFTVDLLSNDAFANAADEFEVTELVPETTEPTEDILYEISDDILEDAYKLNEANSSESIENEYMELESTLSPNDEEFELTTEANFQESIDEDNEFILVSTVTPYESDSEENIFEYIPGSGEDESLNDHITEEVYIIEGSGSSGSVSEDEEESFVNGEGEIIEAFGEEAKTTVATKEYTEELEEYNPVTTLPSIINEVLDSNASPKSKPALPRKIEDKNSANDIIFPEEEEIKSSSLIELPEDTTAFTSEVIRTSDQPDTKIVFPENQNDETTTIVNDDTIKEITSTIDAVPTTIKSLEITTGPSVEEATGIVDQTIEAKTSNSDATTQATITAEASYSQGTQASVTEDQEITENYVTTQATLDTTSIQIKNVPADMKDAQDIQDAEDFTTDSIMVPSSEAEEITTNLPAYESEQNETTQEADDLETKLNAHVYAEDTTTNGDVSVTAVEQLTTIMPPTVYKQKDTTQKQPEEDMETTTSDLSDYNRSTETTFSAELAANLVEETTKSIKLDIVTAVDDSIPETTVASYIDTTSSQAPQTTVAETTLVELSDSTSTDEASEATTSLPNTGKPEKIRASPLKEYMSPIHGCNETETDTEHVTEVVTEQYEANPTYSYFTEETTAGNDELLEDETTTVLSKSYEDIQPKSLKYDGPNNIITSSKKDNGKEEKISKPDGNSEIEVKEPMETTQSILTTESTDAENDNGENETDSSTEQTKSIKENSTTTKNQITEITSTTTQPTTETESIKSTEDLSITSKSTTTTTHSTSTTAKRTTTASLTTDTPFIVFAEKNDLSNEIPTNEEPSKPVKEAIRSTTVSYSIVRPVATYHIVPVKKSESQ
eukprot:TRINITY_DN18532_c0_g1_i1.p1 TRINITY_DN18532_c0_g1~~TRINITY_DN18532_c0_g1_i1.p1  ORF type:complete len:1511 (-),score=466.46 TRINITY_DN18532_c0_g1_i1:301-4173(-)